MRRVVAAPVLVAVLAAAALTAGAVTAVRGHAPCSAFQAPAAHQRAACELLRAIDASLDQPVRIVTTQHAEGQPDYVSTLDVDPRVPGFISSGGGLVNLTIGSTSFRSLTPQPAEELAIAREVGRPFTWVRRDEGSLFADMSATTWIGVEDADLQELRQRSPDVVRHGDTFVVTTADRRSDDPDHTTFTVRNGRLATKAVGDGRLRHVSVYSRYGVAIPLEEPDPALVLGESEYSEARAAVLARDPELRCREQLALVTAGRDGIKATCKNGKLVGPGLVVLPGD